MFQFLLCGHLS